MNDAENWRELCEWLDARRRKCAYRSQVPSHLAYLLSEAWMESRRRADLVQYRSGWGWRLRKDWRAKVDAWNLPKKSTPQVLEEAS